MSVDTIETIETMEETEVINLTEAAAEKLDGIMKEKGVRETHALRVFVSGGGCSGLQYGMTFDPSPARHRHRRDAARHARRHRPAEPALHGRRPRSTTSIA